MGDEVEGMEQDRMLKGLQCLMEKLIVQAEEVSEESGEQSHPPDLCFRGIAGPTNKGQTRGKPAAGKDTALDLEADWCQLPLRVSARFLPASAALSFRCAVIPI